MKFDVNDDDLAKLASIIANVIVKEVKDLGLISNTAHKPYMNKKEASQYVGVSMNSFDKLVKLGLKAIVISDGTATRFSKESIDEFLKQNEK